MNEKILVVEDDLVLQKIISDKLTKENYQVVCDNDGEQGLAAALQNHPDLILLDLVMPKMDGLSMLKKLREDIWGKDARVIITTNLADDSKTEEGMKHGVYDYLVKTEWSLDDLILKVKDKVGNF
jgi:DNA-binding response OmpR family regulator